MWHQGSSENEVRSTGSHVLPGAEGSRIQILLCLAFLFLPEEDPPEKENKIFVAGGVPVTAFLVTDPIKCRWSEAVRDPFALRNGPV